MIWDRIRTWGLVALVLVLAFVFVQWHRMKGIVKDARAELAQKDAENRALHAQRARDKALAAVHAAVDASTKAKLAGIAEKAALDLANAEKRREEARTAAASGDVDALVELGRKMRKEGKIR